MCTGTDHWVAEAGMIIGESSTARTLIDPEFASKHCWADFWQRTLGLCLPPKLQRGNLPFDLPPRRCWGPDPHCERPLLSALPILSFTKA